MSRYIVTLPDDPTLATQAHAAIVAVPGVVCVVAVPGFAMLPERAVPWLRDALAADPVPVELPYTDEPPTYTVGDEEDGEHE